MEKTIDEYIREDKGLRQLLLGQEGFMKYVVEHIDDDGLSLFSQYQEQVVVDYRKANMWNSDLQLLSGDELRLKALGPDNHLMPEFRCRKALESLLADQQEEAADAVRAFYDGYMAFAWREYFERRNPEHATVLGFYKTFMEQFRSPNGLAYLCLKLTLKEHHGEGWTEQDQYDYYRIAEYHYFYLDWCGPHGKRAFARLREGVKEWLYGKNGDECRELAEDMLEKVRFFSQHIYNDELVCYTGTKPFPLEDKRWLRTLVEGFGKKSDTDVMNLLRDFLYLLQEIGRIWAARLLKIHGIDLHQLEKHNASSLRPYNSKKDGFDYFHYVDHYYTEDNPNTCCVKDCQHAKKLIYNLYAIEEGDNMENTADIVQGGGISTNPRNEREDGDGKPPRLGRKAKPFQEFLKDDAPEGLMNVLHEMLAGKSGGEAFPIILAIKDVYVDVEPTPQSVITEFGVAETPYREAKRKHEGVDTYKTYENGKKKQNVKEPQPVSKETLDKIRDEIEKRLNKIADNREN